MKIAVIVVWAVLAAGAVAAMFHISFEVEKLEARLRDVNREIAREQEEIHVLKAEWSYLNRPQRLEFLSQELLPQLAPVQPGQFITFARLPRRDVGRQDQETLSLGPAAHLPEAVRPAGGHSQ